MWLSFTVSYLGSSRPHGKISLASVFFLWSVFYLSYLGLSILGSFSSFLSISPSHIFLLFATGSQMKIRNKGKNGDIDKEEKDRIERR